MSLLVGAIVWMTRPLPSRVGTYCSVLSNIVAHMAEQLSVYFIVTTYCERLSVQISEKTIVFLHQFKIKLALVESIRSPSGLYVESCSGFKGLDQESWKSLHPDGVQQEYTWSLAGFFNNVKGYYLERVQMDSRETPDGVHQDVWLSVTTSVVQPILLYLVL
jgi:hypothetical protein